MTFQKNTVGASDRTGRIAELLSCPDDSGVEHAGNGVADLEHMWPGVQVLSGLADLGHPESLAALPAASGREPARRPSRIDVISGFCRTSGLFWFVDVPVPEDAVPSDGKLTGDGLDGVELAVGVDGEVGGVVAEDHRVRGAVAAAAGGSRRTPRGHSSTKRDEHQRDQPA